MISTLEEMAKNMGYSDFIINPNDKNGNNIFNMIPDIFGQDFDRTWMAWSDGGDYSATYSMLQSELGVIEDDGEVEYVYNREGFRSDNFEISDDRINILFAGCSQTEGVGSPLETVWSKTVFNQISKNNDVSGFMSIARAGYGWQKVVTNFMTYVKKYGFPDYLFVMLPNASRFWDWSNDDSRWFYVQRYPSGQNKDSFHSHEKDIFSRPLTVSEHRRSMIEFAFGWKMFEQYCAEHGVKILWSSWDPIDSKNFGMLNISNNYIELTEEEFDSFVEAARPDGKIQKHDIDRRDGHSGILFHEYWHHKFVSKIGELGWLNV